MEVTLSEKDADDWVYRGEGAANLVLAYIGSSPAFVRSSFLSPFLLIIIIALFWKLNFVLFLQIGKVMRIRKAPRHDSLIVTTPSPSSLTAHERLLWKDVDELISSSDHELASQLFVLHVMKPLLGSKFVDAGVCLLFQLPIITFMLIY
jgi:inositol-pentakisphosphate 2-kinase